MANIVLKNYDGDDKTFEGVDRVKLNTVGGGTQIFSEGEVLEGLTLELDLADGDQIVTAPPGMLVKSATILKPETLKPENIVKDVEIAGVIGSFAGGGGINMKAGIFTGNGGGVTINHGLGEKPQLIIAFTQYGESASGSVGGGTRSVSMGMCVGVCDDLKAKLGWPYHKMAACPYSTTSLYMMRWSGCIYQTTGYVINSVTDTQMTIGGSYSQTFSGKTYRWIAMSGLV